MPKVTQSHLDTRRQLILDSAVTCFAREGFQRTTIRHIIDESGISAGGIYGYFRGKEEIIAAIAAERHARETALIDAAGEGAALAKVIHGLLADFFGLLADPGERTWRRVSIQLWAEALRSPDIMVIIRQGIDVPCLRLTGLIESAVRRGELSPGLDVDAAARMIIALYHGFILQLAWDDTLEIEDYLPAIEAGINAILGR